MKKFISIITILFVVFMLSFSANSFAAALDTINITTTKQKIHPGENVTVDIDFGVELGSYTFDIAYDNNLFEYVSNNGGTAVDHGTKVIVSFYDTAGGTSPRSNTSVTFKAKKVDSSNPTDFSITANALANPDGSTSYDDITVPVTKSVVVEPDYKDYDISLKYDGEVIKNKEKDMKLVVSSAWGHNYEHTRILAKVTTPEGATAKLLATDSSNLEHDIIDNGWGDADGDPIGGENAVKELAVRGLFDKAGKYSITFSLINRDDSDNEIAKKTVEINVKDKETTTADKEETTDKKTDNTEEVKDEEPTVMPKTGNTVYVYTIPALLTLTAAYITLRKKN